MSNKKLSLYDLEILRQKAVEAVIVHGMSKKQASITFGFSSSSIWKYLKEYEMYKEESFRYKKRGVKAGAKSKINTKQKEELKSKILSHTTDELGMDHRLWNSKVV